MTGIAIRGMGSALPGEGGYRGNVVNGNDVLFQLHSKGKLACLGKLDNAKRLVAHIEEKTGIKTRNFADAKLKYPATYYATAAAIKTLENANVNPSNIQGLGLYCVTDTPDFIFPSQGILVAKLLGLKPVMFGNNSMACASIAGALKEASRDIKDGLCERALILAGDIATRLKLSGNSLEPLIFGDGFVGMFLEKDAGNGGFVFSNLSIETAAADLFIHRHYYSGELGMFHLGSMRGVQFNDNGLDMLGDIDATEISLQLQDFLNNSKIEIDDGTKVVLPQASKQTVNAGIKNFRDDTGFDLTGHVVANQAYKHGNIGAGAIPLAWERAVNSGEIKPTDKVLFDIVGVGGVGTVFTRDPNANQAVTLVRIEDKKERPDYLRMVEDVILEREKRIKSREQSAVKNGSGKSGKKSGGLERAKLNRALGAGNNGTRELDFKPLHRLQNSTVLGDAAKVVSVLLNISG